MKKGKIHKWLITGAGGFIGSHLCQYLAKQHEILGTYFAEPVKSADFNLQPLDILNRNKVEATLAKFKPDCVVHFAGEKNVRWCEDNPHAAFRVNTEGLKIVAEVCKEIKSFLIFQSSDHVFEGKEGNYSLSSECHPTTVYGQSKLAAEQILLNVNIACAIIRSGGIYAAINPSASVLGWAYETLKKGEIIEAYDNIYNSPTYIEDLSMTVELIGKQKISGVFHLGGSSRESRYSFLKLFAKEYDFQLQLVKAARYISQEQNIRPQDLSLDSKVSYKKLRIKFHNSSSGLKKARKKFKSMLPI